MLLVLWTAGHKWKIFSLTIRDSSHRNRKTIITDVLSFPSVEKKNFTIFTYFRLRASIVVQIPMVINVKLKNRNRVKASCYEWEALINFEGKRKEKHVGGEKRKEKKGSLVCPPVCLTLALHALPAFQYSIATHLANVTHRSAKRVRV